MSQLRGNGAGDGDADFVFPWKAKFEILLDGVKEYTVRRPVEGLLLAFAAGLLVSSLLKRDR